MSTQIISAAVFSQQQLISYDSKPEFRKATLNMKMSCAVLQEAMDPLRDKIENVSQKMSLLVATGHGEFNSTIEFLKEWSLNKHARPFVFQNSLHNSTTGFLTLQKGITAPSFTLSHHYFSGEEALDMAQQLIIGKLSSVVAVVGVDARIQSHLANLKGEGFPHAGWGQGAGAVILASQDFCAQHQLQSFGELKKISMEYQQQKTFHDINEGFSIENFYDSQAVETLASAVLEKKTSPITLPKPNGGSSQIIWTTNV